MLSAFVGPRPSPAHQAAHLDDDKSNNALSNLAWATPLENMAQRAANGRQTRGEDIPVSVLTTDQVRYVRSALARGATQRGLARELGVSDYTIRNIDKGVTWRHVQ